VGGFFSAERVIFFSYTMWVLSLVLRGADGWINPASIFVGDKITCAGTCYIWFSYTLRVLLLVPPCAPLVLPGKEQFTGVLCQVLFLVWLFYGSFRGRARSPAGNHHP
jgi:hypothetical protein